MFKSPSQASTVEIGSQRRSIELFPDMIASCAPAGRSNSNRTMAEPRLSSLHRVVQKLGLDEVIPHLTHASDHDLHAPSAKFLVFSECHEDLDIPEQRFNPTALPEIAYSEVQNDSIEDRLLGDPRSPLMKPYFTTISMREIQTLVSQEPSGTVSLIDPPLDTDDFLGCRVFFRVVAEAVEQGMRIVVLREEEQRIGLVVRIKSLRWLKTTPGTVSRAEKETVLFQVEYTFMDKEDAHSDNEKNLSELLEQQPKGKIRICLGTKHQVHFVFQVLQAHERLLSKSVISEHDKRWKPRQKFVRPSFIVPLRTLSECACREELYQEIGATVVSPASDACAVCRNVDVKLKVCAGCKSINYCGHECQAADWRFHKPTCRALRSVPK